MNDLEQLFQQRIEQLEAGKPLEVCLEELPEKEARALRLIADIRSVSFSEADEESTVEQRAAVLGAAEKRLGAAAAPATLPRVSLFSQLQTWLDWLLTRRELAVGLALVLVIALLSMAWFGLTQDRNGDEADPT